MRKTTLRFLVMFVRNRAAPRHLGPYAARLREQQLADHLKEVLAAAA